MLIRELAVVCYKFCMELMSFMSFVSDINECAFNNGNCAQNCSNRIGSYLCSCNTGYLLNVDGFICNGKKSRS